MSTLTNDFLSDDCEFHVFDLDFNEVEVNLPCDNISQVVLWFEVLEINV